MSVNPKRTDIALPQLPAELQLVMAAVLANGALVLLTSDADLEREWRRDSNGWVLGKPFEVAARAKSQLWFFDDTGLVEGPSFPLETPFPRIDRFDDGRWLVVACRTRGEPNARVLTPDGQLLARFMLGDGIEHVGVDRHDQIWVGWFDEGIFGNEKWRVPNEQWPPSTRGMGCFRADGAYQKLPDFPQGAGIIADCYALNIADDGVWTCPYMEFPLFQLQSSGPLRWWSNEISGPKALAVFEGHALLAGGYGSDANRLTLIALDGEGDGHIARTVATWRLPLVPRQPERGEPREVTEGHPWLYPTLLAGRGEAIHMLQNGVWYRWRVSDALRAVESAGHV